MKLNKGGKQTGRILAWAGYDFANTIYSMNVVSLYFPLFIIANLGHPDIYVSAATSVSMLIVAFTAPFLGYFSDNMGRRMPFLIVATVVCCLGTACIGIFGKDPSNPVILLLGLFVIANVSYHLGLVFYNSLLPVVSPPGRTGRVSGLGVALGYIGSIVGMILILPFNDGTFFGCQVPWIKFGGRIATFVPTSILFLLFALPTFIGIREKKLEIPVPPKDKINPLREILDTLIDSKRYPGIRRFLVSKFLFQEGIESTIIFMGVYLEKVLGFPDSSKIHFFVIATLGAAVGSWLFGMATDRIGSYRTLNIVLIGWLISLILVLPIRSKILFYIIGIFIGALLGGIWTTTRPLLLKLTPPDAVGRFFGLYSLSGKAAAFMGPLIWGLVTLVTTNLGDAVAYRCGVGALALFVGAGWLVFRPLRGIFAEEFEPGNQIE